MARQNNIPPRGADAHLRQPNAAHDPSAPAQGYGSAFPHQQYGAHDQGGQQSHAGSSQRDIFNALRPDPPSLGSRFEPFAAPAGRPQGQSGVQSHSGHQGGHQGGYGRQQQPFSEPEADPYAAPAFGGQTHDPYGRPLPGGGYPAQGGYGGAEQHDQAYYGQQQPQHGYAPQGGQYGHEEAYSYDDPYRPQSGDPYAGGQHAGQGTDGAYYDEDYAEEPEGKRSRGPRAIVVIGALIGAIVLGGGLAYGYKAMTSSGRDSAKLPVLRADSAPTKGEPTEPGGKQMAHTDKKFLNRLTEDRAQPRPVPVSIQPPPPERESADGPRRVPTLVVNRDGSIGQSSAPPPAGPAGSGVPGLLVDGLSPRVPPPQREAAALPPPAPPAPPARAMSVEAPPPPSAPRRVASAPTVAAVEPAPALVVPRAEPDARRPVPTPTQRQAARTPPPAAAAPTPSAATSSGWVAVIASRQSHMDALKSLADIQQRYPGVLQGRAADVREANLGDKGMWYRAVVGPPTSREAASSVCGALTKQGYSGCWVTPY